MVVLRLIRLSTSLAGMVKLVLLPLVFDIVLDILRPPSLERQGLAGGEFDQVPRGSNGWTAVVFTAVLVRTLFHLGAVGSLSQPCTAVSQLKSCRRSRTSLVFFYFLNPESAPTNNGFQRNPTVCYGSRILDYSFACNDETTT